MSSSSVYIPALVFYGCGAAWASGVFNLPISSQTLCSKSVQLRHGVYALPISV